MLLRSETVFTFVFRGPRFQLMNFLKIEKLYDFTGNMHLLISFCIHMQNGMLNHYVEHNGMLNFFSKVFTLYVLENTPHLFISIYKHYFNPDTTFC